MEAGWHTYWRNSGDSGAPTTVEWTLPAGLAAGEILWPAPEIYPDQELTTYVHHGKLMLLVRMQVAATATPGETTLAAKVRWLQCKDQCIPGGGDVQGKLRIGANSVPSPDAAAVAAAASKVPQPSLLDKVVAQWDGPASGDERTFTLRWRVADPVADKLVPGTNDFLAYESPQYTVATATERLEGASGEIVLRKKISRVEGDWPASIPGLLVRFDSRNSPVRAFEVNLMGPAGVASPGPVTPLPPGQAARGAPARAAGVASLSLPQAIGMGLIGGMILNIMPCVLPVIALKILGFVRQAGNRPREIRRLGLIYALGVWVSFLVLAMVVISVKSAVGIASWGMQFGNPVFLISMCTLVLLVALSLFGVFEFNVTGRALDQAGELASREGTAGAFFNGVLAVVLATPCTAPFLAPALGYAFTASAATIVLIFTSVAVGLALPYVVLSFQPSWLKFLPKPGAWMERFKVAMGFPMLATALWLYTLTASRHFGDRGPFWLGLFLVGVALSAWVWGEFVQRGRSRQAWGMGMAFALLAVSYGLVLEGELQWRAPRQPATKASQASGSPSRESVLGAPAVVDDRIHWQPWSRELVAQLRSARRPIFVDFTADWCPNCKYNERRAIEIPSVRETLTRTGTIPLKADHTDFPRAITEELQRFGQAGVPMVLVYPRDPAAEPVVLPTYLNASDVLDALEAAARE